MVVLWLVSYPPNFKEKVERMPDQNPDQQTTPQTPQQRWQQFRDTKLPKLTRRQRSLLIGGSVLLTVLFTLIVLPFLLPFTGPEPQNPHTLADPNGAFITIEDTELYYCHAAGNGETVLLIHGQIGSTLTWRETIPTLQAAGFEVYALDLAGAGLSEKGWDLDYSHAAQMKRIIAFMDAHHIVSAHIVAHAFGGNIAMMLALEHPERVKKLVLIAPTLFFGGTTQIPPIVFDVPFLHRWTRVLLQLVLPDAVGEQLRSAVRDDTIVTDQLIADYSRGLSVEGWDEAAMGMARDFHRNALTKSLTVLEAPVLFIWGTEDGWASSLLVDDIVDELHSMERLDLEGVGHLPMHEAPQDFNVGLIKFLDN